jgi:hypothetical protein
MSHRASVIYFRGMITDDGKQLLIDDQPKLKADYKLLAGYAVEGELRKLKSTRSTRQNAWLWSFLKPLAEHLGYEVEELKLVGLVAVFGTKVVGGMTIPEKAHTSQLNTEEFSDLCEWFVQKAAEVDYLVLYPEEFKREKRKQLRRGTGNGESHARRSHGGDLSGVNPDSASDSAAVASAEGRS